jgi:hypothetical protein
VRVLTGSSHRGVAARSSNTTIEYVVDAETYAPISARATTRIEEAGAVASTSAAFGR